MDAGKESELSPMTSPAAVERKSERELVITRTIHGPASVVFEAWTKPELFKRWWVPKSCPISLLSCEMDVRLGGTYRLVFDVGAEQTMACYGKYLEVKPHARLVWTNEEGDAGVAVTTVTFDDNGAETRLVMHELHPSKEALDGALGAADGTRESLEQLDEFVLTLAAREGHS